MTTNLKLQKAPISKAFDAPVTAEEMDRIPGKETKEKRTRGGKIFNLGRNLHQAVLYADPVHYRDKQTGEWEEIDNTLIPVTDDSGNTYLTNRANDELNVELHRTGDAAAILTEDDSGRMLAWRLEDAADVEPVRIEKPCRERSVCDLRRDVLARVEDEAVYPGVFPGADLRCRLQGLSFKDEVIFSTPESVRPVTFLLDMPGLVPERKDNGDIELIAPTGETVFTLPRPVMRDSHPENGAGAVACTLEPAGELDTWRMTCTPDASWIAKAEFPVTLDPAVITKKHSSAIEDNFITSSQPNTVQPYAGTGMTVSNSSGTWGESKAFIKFLDSGLPEIDSSYYVTKALFSVMTRSAPTTAASVYLKEALADWNSQTITYNNAPALNSLALDYAYMSANNTWYTYDISNLARKWYGGTNYGFALEAGSRTYLELYTSDHAYNKPYVTINYVSLAGLEDYLAYEDQDAGLAGTGHVSLYNGNLIFERQDTSCGGQRAPASVSHVYNSCYHGVTAYGAGKGWKTNLHQTLHKETLEGATGSVTYYVYMDGDGTRHHFKQVSGAWKDQSGLGMTLAISGGTAAITDKGHNTMTFDLPNVEFAGNYANVKMLKTMSDACGNTITITSAGCVIDNVTDGAGRNTGFANYNGRLDTLYPPSYGESGYCGFTYDGAGNLTGVWELAGAPGTENMTYTYDSLGLLTSAVNCDGMKVAYEYYTAREPYRVKKATISNGSLVSYSRQYEYRDNLTVVTDLLGGSDKKLYYHFNDYGNVVSVNDELGYAAFAKYSDQYPVNHPETVSRLQKSVVNLLRDSGFEKGNAWTLSGGMAYATDSKYMGSRSLKVTTTGTTTGGHAAQQTVTVTPGKTYTLSWYARKSGNIDIWSCFTYTNAQGALQYAHQPSLKSQLTTEYTRLSQTFTVPADVSSNQITIILYAGAGNGEYFSAWFDCVQLEEGPVANRYNLLQNGDFSTNSGAHPTDWSKNSSNTASDIVYTTYDGVKPAGLSANTMRIYGEGRTKYAGIYQDIPVSGSQGDVFVAGGWSLNHSMPRKGEDFRYNIRVAFLKAGTSSTRENAPSIEWSEEWTGWQFAAGPVIAPCSYTSIRFNVDYERNINYTDFDGFFLHKEEFGQTYVYDIKGNVLSAKNAASLQDGATYDAFDNILTYFQPGRSSSVKTTMEWGATDAEKKKHLLRKAASPLGIVDEYTYDEYGSLLSSKTSGGSIFTQTTTAYTSNGNHVEAQTDARGKTVTRSVNAARDTLTSVTDPRGQTVSYTYDQIKRVTQTSATVSGRTHTASYGYTKDKLTQVKHNTSASASDDVTYTFGYDGVGRPATVKVGAQTLSTTAYSADGTVANVTYGNGGKAVNTYDAFKRVTGVRFDSETTPHFSYTYGANGAAAQIKDNARGVTVTSEYDAANRPMRKTIMEGNTHAYTGEVTYDQYNNLAAFKEQVGGGRTAYATAFTHDNENRPTLIDFGGSRQVAYTYDGIGRITQRSVNAGGTAVAAQYTYLPGGHGTGSTTPIVQTITQLGSTLTYTYDDAGNITSVSDGSKTVSYAYDLLGQLTRTDDPYDTTAGSAGTTWVYAYDLGGNFTGKTAYAYTTGAVGTAAQTVAYAYGDANWRDKLTAYNGAAITYDAIGNPLSDGAWTYTWAKGRQLQQMSKSGQTVSFTYNEDGLRVRKTAATTGDTKYTLHGRNIVHLTNGGNTLHFFYDAQSKPAVVLFNNTAYAYVYNLQGDVIALVDANGAKVVEYRYDAWGKQISKTGSMASSLGTLNPFRYRGYVYDEETGLYYLRNRYYKPTWGRFINADQYLAAVGSSIKGCNLFAYCVNNPVNLFDSDGVWPNWLTGALNVISGALEMVAGVTLGVTVGWTGFGAAAAAALVIDGAATASQGVGQIINDVSGTQYMREDNIARTGVQAIGQVVAGESGAIVAGAAYDATIFAASMYLPAKATQHALQQAGRIPIKVPISNLRNNPFDEFVTIGPKSGKVAQYCRTLTVNNYGPIYVTELRNGFYQIANGHHRIEAMRRLNWKVIKVYITK